MVRWLKRNFELLRLNPPLRWLITGLLLLAYVIRCWTYGYFAVTYFMSLYQLFLLVQFCTPTGLPDPSDEEFQMPGTAEEYEGFVNDNDRPLVRKVPEFDYWVSSSSFLVGGLVCTFFQFLNIPIYWPFLMIYVMGLALFTIRKHYVHMSKYGYSVFDFLRKGSNK